MYNQLSKWWHQFICSPAVRRCPSCSIFLPAFLWPELFNYFARLVRRKWCLSSGSVSISPMVDEVIDFVPSILVSRVSSSVKCPCLGSFFFFLLLSCLSFLLLICRNSKTFWILNLCYVCGKSSCDVWQIFSLLSLLMNRSF